MNGAYNAAINDNTTNSVFSDTLAKVYGYKICLCPKFFDQDGEMCKKILTGRRISSDKLETGFHFKHRNLEDTLRDCLSK
jgi:NAD dependent epimerase/dehydratase family enzyme